MAAITRGQGDRVRQERKNSLTRGNGQRVRQERTVAAAAGATAKWPSSLALTGTGF